MKPKWGGTLRREVFNKNNSICTTARIKELDVDNWWTDGCNFISKEIYLHVKYADIYPDVYGLNGTGHRVWPRKVKGYQCRRIEIRDGLLYWLYDKVKPKTNQ